VPRLFDDAQMFSLPTDEARQLMRWEDDGGGGVTPAKADSIVGQHQRARELVNAAVANHVAAWASTVALTSTDARFDRFREDVTEALHACMRAHIAVPYRTHERAADVRKDFVALANAATAAAEKFREVQTILDRLPPPMLHDPAPPHDPDPAFRLAHPPWSVIFELEGLAAAAHRHAESWVDRGGPSPMRAFAALVRGHAGPGLEQAFQQATGNPARVAWDAHRDRYEGKFLDFVEILLATAREIAEAVTGRPLPEPKTPMARGKFLHDKRYLSPKDKTHRK
jgi:hypothetical protein